MYYQSLPPAWEAFIIGHTLEPDPHAMIGGPKGRTIEPHPTPYNVPDRSCSATVDNVGKATPPVDPQ